MGFIRYLLLLKALFALQLGLCQETAEIQGKLLDSVKNLTIEAASVSIYEAGSDNVYRLVLSSADGQFTIQKVAVNKKYRIRVQHQRYESIEMEVAINTLKTIIGNLYLRERLNKIEEVEVLAPVRMNGDTIEFNADAFKLDSNAVAGDLLTKLPGITIWGDEEITYNGKKISKVLVNGKPFFSANSKIALGNIPKGSIQKVQIYDTEKDDRQTKDINLVLKKGKDKGAFGKFGGGAALEKYYEGEFVLSAFDKNNQLSIGSVTNNLNKPLKNLDMLMSNTSFGGITVKTDYFPDMRRLGDNKETAIGGRYQRDFKPQSGVRKKSHIVQDVFYKEAKNVLSNESTTNWLASSQANNKRELISSSDDLNKVFNSNFSYDYDNDHDRKLKFILNTQVVHRKREGFLHALSDINQVRYQEEQSSFERNKEQGLNFETSYTYNPKSKSGRFKWFDGINFNYKLNTGQEEGDRLIQKRFHREGGDIDNRNLDRRYTQDNNRSNQDMSFRIEDLFPSFFRNRVKFGLMQSLIMNRSHADWRVLDSLRQNNRLTFSEESRRAIYKGGMSATREFVFQEVHRIFKKSIRFSANALFQSINESNISGYGDRTFKRAIATFNPSAVISYIDMVDQDRLWHIDIDWRRNPNIPTLDQLRPVVDDINLLNLYFGNPDLENGFTNSITLKFRKNKFGKLPENLEMLIGMDISDKAIMESIIFTDDGRREVYLKNDPQTQQSYVSTLNYSRSYKFSESKNMTAKLGMHGTLQTSNQELSDEIFNTEIRTFSGELDLGFQLSPDVRMGLKQKSDFYFQQALGIRLQNFNSKTYDTNLGIAFKVFKRATFNANASYLNIENNFETKGSFILNSSLSMRFLKGNNLEFKFSASDILNNNSGLFSRVNSSYITYGTHNIIRQYFLLTLSYFPRFF